MQLRFSPGRPLGALLYPVTHIRWRIIAPYAALTIVLAVAGTFLVTRLVGGSLDERFNNQLAEAGRVASDALVRRERQHLEAARAVAFTEGIGAATWERAPYDIARLVQPIVVNSGVERVEVLDSSGRRLYGVKLADRDSLEYASVIDSQDRRVWGSVKDVIAGRSDERGDKFSEIVSTSDGYVLYTAAPIFDGRRLAGVVLIGTPLDVFVDIAKSEALADVTIYAPDGEPLASTFALDSADDVQLAPEGELAAGAPVRERHTLFGRDFDLLYGTLYLRGEPVAAYSVGLPSSFIYNAQAATRWQMALLFAGGMAAALVIGWLIARSLTEPIFALARAADAVSSGDLSSRSGVNGRDEIGSLGRAFDAMAERLQRQHLATVRALTSAIDARDPYTMGHSMRVGQLAVELGKELGVSPVQLQHLEIGGYLHDIGKIGVRDSVLLKPGALSPEEREAIERHPSIGLRILEHVELAGDVLAFVGGHHEKLDGSGYPDGLHDHEISIVARIATVADIYDALTTDRPYRRAMSVPQALDILHHEAEGGLVDRYVVAALVRIVDVWEERRRSDPELRGFSVEGAAADDKAA